MGTKESKGQEQGQKKLVIENISIVDLLAFFKKVPDIDQIVDITKEEMTSMATPAEKNYIKYTNFPIQEIMTIKWGNLDDDIHLKFPISNVKKTREVLMLFNSPDIKEVSGSLTYENAADGSNIVNNFILDSESMKSEIIPGVIEYIEYVNPESRINIMSVDEPIMFFDMNNVLYNRLNKLDSIYRDKLQTNPYFLMNCAKIGMEFKSHTNNRWKVKYDIKDGNYFCTEKDISFIITSLFFDHTDENIPYKVYITTNKKNNKDKLIHFVEDKNNVFIMAVKEES